MDQENKNLQSEEIYDEQDLYDDLKERDETPEQYEEGDRKDKVIANKFIFFLLCLLMFSIPVLWFFGYGIPVDTDAVFVGDIAETQEGTLEVPLRLSSSGLAFTVTTQQEEDGILTLRPRASLVGLHQSGSTTVKVKFPAEELREIWLEGDDENDRLRIWRSWE